MPAVQENLYGVSGSTATGFECYDVAQTFTWYPDRQLSHLLAHLNAELTPAVPIGPAMTSGAFASGNTSTGTISPKVPNQTSSSNGVTPIPQA